MYNGASRWGQAFYHWCLAVFSFWYTWLYKGVTCFVFLLSFPLSLPFDLTLSCWVYVCCFVLLYFGCYVMLCVKKNKTPAKVSWAFKMVSQFGSLGYTIMGKTADLTVVQKTIIDTLHKEGKPQTFIAKEAGCSQSAVSKHVNRKLNGRKKCGRKRCKTNRENRSLMRIVKQNRFKNLGELHKEWTEAGVKAAT